MKLFLSPDWHTTYVCGVYTPFISLSYKYLQHSSVPRLLMHPGYATVYLMLFVHFEISEKLILSLQRMADRAKLRCRLSPARDVTLHHSHSSICGDTLSQEAMYRPGNQ